ncbi:MAG TPA: protein kinase, partial [Planctomycetota bacterium]|nr:protein kinase [Planctomycetota bacterium]
MAKLPELEIAKRAVQEGNLPQEVLDACLSEKRKARADGLDLTLRELLQEKGFFSAQAWDALERRASTTETRGDLRPSTRAAQVTAPSTSSRLIPTAEFLGEYRIIKEIGRGAMGIVYEAIQGTLGRRVALKVLPAGTAMSGVARERFNREARAAASLNHPNIVPIYDQGEERGVPFFAMELVNGRTLKDVLNEEGPLDTNRAVALGIQAARALDYAHERGVIHRDVKPDNLFLQSPKKTKSKSGTHEKEKVLLADFGLATRLDDATLTREGTAVGTPLYMSPEQASGDREHTDRRADVYGLGATLYELLSGTPPFSGSPDTQTLLARIRDEEVVALRLKIDQQRKAGTPRAPADIPPALEAVVMRTLEKDPNRRYWTAGELADDLEAFLQGEPVSAKPPTLLERLRRVARRRARWLSLVLALVVFVALLVGLAAPLQRSWRADTILIQAADMERGGRRDEAHKLLEEALALVPTHARARARLASLLLNEGEARRAREELDRAVADDGRCLEARLLRGDLERKAGELDKALEDYDAAARLTEGDPRPHYGRGAVLVAKGDMAAAAKELGRGLELARASRTHTADDPGYREAVRLSGEARTAAGDAAGAQTDLEEAIRLDPDAPSPRILLGKMLAARGQDKLAVEAFADAIRRKPDDAEAIELRAASRRRIGQAAEALADLAADATKDRPRAHLVRGLILSESLDPGDSRQDFEYDRARAELEGAAQADKDALEPRDRARALVALAW